MAGKDVKAPPACNHNNPKKRKEPPTTASKAKSDFKRPKNDHRAKQRDARALSTQSSAKAFKNGELDVDKFVKSRNYEIRALEEGMIRSKKALNTRAFQQVPKELRRRTASHNAKRMPKRLQPRAKREMADDNTPTVTARRRKPTRHMRLRLETAKKLRTLGTLRKASNSKGAEYKVSVKSASEIPKTTDATSTVKTRAPKVKKAKTSTPPLPKAKFRKRQIDKTWLPTHLFHAKRARMTPPKEPLWRFALPVTPTAKSYRSTHRTANERGAIAWDMSYMSTIALQGQRRSIEGMLKALGVDSHSGEDGVWSAKGKKWTHGVRAWDGFVFEREPPHSLIAPVTIIWSACPIIRPATSEIDSGKQKCTVFVRVHPSAFLQLREELVRLGNVAKPQVGVEDLRFEIGSIEITGPGATEALLGALWPSPPKEGPQHPAGIVEHTWTSLAGLNDPSFLPPSVVLGFDIQDPRLHHPPRTIVLPKTPEQQMTLLEMTAAWPLDALTPTPSLFDRRSRMASTSKLPSQKAINRRKTLAPPGEFPPLLPTDPDIPTLVYSTATGAKKEGAWIVLLPWKCVQSAWYSVMYYPLSSGGQPRFGGLDEQRQLAFETGQPWFPGDFPGTKAGWEWEVQQRQKREADYSRRPKSKRINWKAVKLGDGKKGEVGLGWACDWDRLLRGPTQSATADAQQGKTATDASRNDQVLPEPAQDSRASAVDAPKLIHVPTAKAEQLLRSTADADLSQTAANSVVTVRLLCLTRGTPQHCARIYRLPSSPAHASLRQEWLALHPRNNANKRNGPKNGLPHLPKDAPPHIILQRLARSLLEPARAGDDNYPACPPEEDLIGFVTTGNLNLSEGRGTGIGSILLSKVFQDVKANGDDGRLCIVRIAGNSVGRLAKWDIV